MGTNIQVCWEKFCRYWQVEPRLVPMAPGRLHLTGPEAASMSSTANATWRMPGVFAGACRSPPRPDGGETSWVRKAMEDAQ